LSTLTVFDPNETQKPGSLFWYDMINDCAVIKWFLLK
jgi:hypothetical protein